MPTKIEDHICDGVKTYSCIGYCRGEDRECGHSKGIGPDGLTVCSCDTCPYEEK